MYDPLSRLCVVRLTQLLELSSVEGLQNLEQSSFVSKNIAIEEKESESFDGLCDAKPFCKQKSPKNQVKKLFKNISRKEAPHVFGQQVSEATLEMIIQLIDHLKESASTEGLFRISGNKKRQEELKNILNKQETLDLDAADCPYNAHDIAGILKYFFSELPEPLLTKSCFICYQQLAGKLKEMDSSSRHSRKVDTLRMLFLLLPPLNRLLLKKLIEMLAVVAADATNRMTSFNLGVIFAPNIVCTRQPMGCLSDFTENVEPFTDLVKFIIENSEEVFQIPSDFMEEAKEYLEKVAQDDDCDVEVPITRKYCEQIDVKEFTKEAQENTNQELMLLYSQVADMPDGPIKRDFLEKFKQSYPGTPMFVPKSVKEKRKDSMDLSSCPSTPASKSKFGCLASCSVKKAASENFLDMPSSQKNIEKNSMNFGTPGKSEDNILAACNSSKKVSQTPSTPTRMKNMYKRIRRRSIELFRSKEGKSLEAEDVPRSKKIQSSETSVSGANKGSQSRLKDFFRSSTRSATRRTLKKSVSTPTLITRRKDSMSLEELGEEKRKLSFSTDLVSADTVYDASVQQSSVAKTYDQGFINDAFVDVVVEEPQLKVHTPVIRKALCPVVVNSGVAVSAAARNSELQNNILPVVKDVANTPKILKPKYNNSKDTVKNTTTKQKTASKPAKSVAKNLMGKSKLPVLASKQLPASKQPRTPLMETRNAAMKNALTDSTKTSSSIVINRRPQNKENAMPSS